jgi:hypothetical protein
MQPASRGLTFYGTVRVKLSFNGMVRVKLTFYSTVRVKLSFNGMVGVKLTFYCMVQEN